MHLVSLFNCIRISVVRCASAASRRTRCFLFNINFIGSTPWGCCIKPVFKHVIYRALHHFASIFRRNMLMVLEIQWRALLIAAKCHRCHEYIKWNRAEYTEFRHFCAAIFIYSRFIRCLMLRFFHMFAFPLSCAAAESLDAFKSLSGAS